MLKSSTFVDLPRELSFQCDNPLKESQKGFFIHGSMLTKAVLSILVWGSANPLWRVLRVVASDLFLVRRNDPIHFATCNGLWIGQQ